MAPLNGAAGSPAKADGVRRAHLKPVVPAVPNIFSQKPRVSKTAAKAKADPTLSSTPKPGVGADAAVDASHGILAAVETGVDVEEPAEASPIDGSNTELEMTTNEHPPTPPVVESEAGVNANAAEQVQLVHVQPVPASLAAAADFQSTGAGMFALLCSSSARKITCASLGSRPRSCCSQDSHRDFVGQCLLSFRSR